MPIITYGINHKTAPLDVREQMVFDPTHTTQALTDLMSRRAVNEAVLVSTCNRTEIYTTPNHSDTIMQWLRDYHLQSKLDITPFCYYYQGVDAIRHLMRVASGLDSMALGEPEIFGQVKQAYQIASETGAVGKHMQHLFPSVFSACKHIRAESEIGRCPVTLAYATVQLAKRIYSQLSRCRVLLIGAGKTIELIATHLSGQGVKQITFANRTVERAHELADQFEGEAIRIGDIPHCLNNTDIVISATASQLPILGKGLIENVVKSGKRRPLFMADLAVPRDIEPEVAQLEDVYLYNIDDLQSVINDNLKNREQAAQQAEAMVDIHSMNYMRQLRLLSAGDMIHDYRHQLESLKQAELEKAVEQIQRGHDPQAVLHTFSHVLINKIMHGPTLKLREAAHEDNVDMLLLAKDLFEL